MISFIRRKAINLYELAASRRFLSRLAELNRTQWLTQEELLALQQDKLHRLLEYAYSFVPYYRRLFDQVGFQPNDILTDPASFQKIPTISKTVINDNFDELVTTDPRKRKRLSRNSTGGSTGHLLIFMQDDDFRDYVTADIHRHIQWTGWQFGECHAYIWGGDYEVATRQLLRTRLMDWALNRFVANAFALSEASMAAFVQDIRQKRPKVLFGYASALARFAEFVQAHHLDDIKFLSVISSAEVLYPHQRELIERTFGCGVIDRYGTRELGGIACECQEHMGLHISTENVCVEILRNGVPVPVGEEGDIVVTNLNNYGMPFIRYQTGDVGQLSDVECRCGRGLPMMQIVSGRATDLFKTKDGRTIHRAFFTHLFYDIGEVKQFQVTQESYNLVVVSIVERSPLPSERLVFLERAIKDMIQSDVKVEFEFLDAIPLQPSGKYRFIISKVQ
jgi:phenylacetate-CoA ligase